MWRLSMTDNRGTTYSVSIALTGGDTHPPVVAMSRTRACPSANRRESRRRRRCATGWRPCGCARQVDEMAVPITASDDDGRGNPIGASIVTVTAGVTATIRLRRCMWVPSQHSGDTRVLCFKSLYSKERLGRQASVVIQRWSGNK